MPKKHKISKDWIYFFKEISKIPRGSNKETAIANFLTNCFKEIQAEVIRDSNNNIVARIPAIDGYETIPMITLQAHSDMITIKRANSKHNFKKDPIKLIFKSNKITARDTTLGADNGAGVALILAIFTNIKEQPHGALEAIITSKEEIGLLGAKQIDPHLIKGQYLINLDGNNDKKIIIACVGSLIIKANIKLKLTSNPYLHHFNITIDHLLGGHSGNDIDKPRINAIKAIFSIIEKINKFGKLSIGDIQGGTFLNAIPTKASIIFSTNLTLAKIKHICKTCVEDLKINFPNERQLKLQVSKLSNSPFSIDCSQSENLITFFNQVFNGVWVVNQKYQLPDTSCNLGKVYIEKQQFHVEFNGRYLNNLHVKKMKMQIINSLNKVKAIYAIHQGLTWNSDLKISNFAKDFQNYVQKKFKRKLLFSYATGGMEPKDLLRRIPSFKVGFSIGPNITSEHSINETLSISSTDFIYKLLINLSSMFTNKKN